eukprot:scaffold22211_cov56-Phaeocystis_antarctica.AAC.2
MCLGRRVQGARAGWPISLPEAAGLWPVPHHRGLHVDNRYFNYAGPGLFKRPHLRSTPTALWKRDDRGSCARVVMRATQLPCRCPPPSRCSGGGRWAGGNGKLSCTHDYARATTTVVTFPPELTFVIAPPTLLQFLRTDASRFLVVRAPVSSVY